MTVRAPVGDLAISAYESCIGRGVCAIKGNKFIYYKLLNSKINKYWERLSTGTTIMAVTSVDIKNMFIYIPLNKEQNKIASFLSLVDRRIELQEEKINKLELYKKGMMQKIFNQEICLNNKYLKDVYTIWKEQKLSDISKISKGKQLNKKNFIVNGEYDVINGGRERSGTTNTYNVKANSISISEGGNSCGFVKYNDKNFFAGGHCYFLEKVKINTAYLYQFLKYNEKKIKSLRVGTGLPNIQKNDINNFKILIPSKDEQNKIEYCLSNIDILLNKENLKKIKLNKFKKGLIQQMFV